MKLPSIFRYDSHTQYYEFFELPAYFRANGEQKPRTTGVFEGLARSTDGKGYWTITELPFEKDGVTPTYDKADSPVRMTYFDKKTRKP